MGQPKTKEGNQKRGKLMNLHKSFGLLVAILMPMRLGLRFTSVTNNKTHESKQ